MIRKISNNFQMGKVEGGNFLHCGYRIVSDENGQPSRKKEGEEAVTEKEKSLMRSYAGKLGWLGRNCRPDLLFSQI